MDTFSPAVRGGRAEFEDDFGLVWLACHTNNRTHQLSCLNLLISAHTRLSAADALLENSPAAAAPTTSCFASCGPASTSTTRSIRPTNRLASKRRRGIPSAQRLKKHRPGQGSTPFKYAIVPALPSEQFATSSMLRCEKLLRRACSEICCEMQGRDPAQQHRPIRSSYVGCGLCSAQAGKQEAWVTAFVC